MGPKPRSKETKSTPEDLASEMTNLNIQEQSGHEIEIDETKYAIASVSHSNGDYSHYALNFVISNYVANNPQVRFIEIGRGLQYLQQELQVFYNDPQQTRVIIPIRPEIDGHEIQHFTGLFIERNGEQFRASYIDPVGSGDITDIPQNIRNVISQILNLTQFTSTTNIIQHSKLESGILKTISNHHCGPFVAHILLSLALGAMKVEGSRLQKAIDQGNWQDISNLSEVDSNNFGKALREQHLQLLKETSIELSSTIETDSAFFPRCEYYSRFKDTTYFDMNTPEYWRTYFRSTTRGGDCDRYAKEFKDSLKTFGNSNINPTHTKEHAKSGAFVSPFFHTRYKKIILPNTDSKKIVSRDFLYDKILKYKQSLCSTLKSRIDNSHFNKVVAIYNNEYPCIMICVQGISLGNGKRNIDSWYKMIMSYYVAIVNYLSKNKGISIELVLRSSFGHNIPSVDSTEESFRINIGIIPKRYLDVLLEGLEFLNSQIIPALERSIIPDNILQKMNFQIRAYNKREKVKLDEWSKKLFDTLNLQAVKGQNKKHVNVIHEAVARGRNYPDLLVDLIIEELESATIDYARPLIKMLSMLDYSHKSITLSITSEYSYNSQKKKLNFFKMVQAIEDNEFWGLLAQISNSLHNLGRLSGQIKYKQLEGIYSALEEANLNFIRSSGYQDADDGVGSDSDCEVDSGLGQAKQIPHIYARKIITTTGMRAINVAAFLAFQDIISASENQYRLDTWDMYYETEKAIDNVSDVMIKLFQMVKKDNRSKKVSKILFFDLNKCNVQQNDIQSNLLVSLQGVGKDFLVILDYTSATTDKILEAIVICLQKVRTVLLVNSGLKNEQIGSDMNPYGTLRIVSTDHNKMLSLYYLAKGILSQENFKDYLPKVAHQIRKSYKNSGFVVTNRDIFKQHYKAGGKYQTAHNIDHYYWDFMRNSEEISLLLDNGFTRNQIIELHDTDRIAFFRFVMIIPRLLDEEIIENEFLLSLHDSQNTPDLLNFFEWLLDAVDNNNLMDISLENIAALINFYRSYQEEFNNLINYHGVSLIEASSWDEDEIEVLGSSNVITIIVDEEELSIDDIKNYYSRDKDATVRVINYWSDRKIDSSFDGLWTFIIDKERSYNSDEEIYDDDTLVVYENWKTEDGCPDGWFPKGLYDSDSDRDSYDSDGGRYYAIANSKNSDEKSYEEDNNESEENQSDYSGDEDDRSGSDNDIIDYYITDIVYDNPELIHNLFQSIHCKKIISWQDKAQDYKTLETITKIEAIISKNALAEIVGWHQYVMKALSNNSLSKYATQVIQAVGNLVNNLKEWLDFGSICESIDVEDHVTIILNQLEHWFDFIASGVAYVGPSPRYPDFDPDDYYGGGSAGNNGGYGYNNENNINDIDFSSLFVGQNLTTNSMLDY